VSGGRKAWLSLSQCTVLLVCPKPVLWGCRGHCPSNRGHVAWHKQDCGCEEERASALLCVHDGGSVSTERRACSCCSNDNVKTLGFAQSSHCNPGLRVHEAQRATARQTAAATVCVSFTFKVPVLLPPAKPQPKWRWCCCPLGLGHEPFSSIPMFAQLPFAAPAREG
jgi:hypothetical protein